MQPTLHKLVNRDSARPTCRERADPACVPERHVRSARVRRRRRVRDIHGRLSSVQAPRSLVSRSNLARRLAVALTARLLLCINRDQTTTVVSDSSPFSTVAHLHLDSVSLSPDPKPDVPAQESFVELQARIRSTIDVGVPPVLDEAAQEWEEAARRAYEVVEADSALASSSTPVAEQEAEPTARARRANDGWLYVSEIVAPVEARRCEIEEEVRACFEALEGESAPSHSDIRRAHSSPFSQHFCRGTTVRCCSSPTSRSTSRRPPKRWPSSLASMRSTRPTSGRRRRLARVLPSPVRRERVLGESSLTAWRESVTRRWAWRTSGRPCTSRA